MNNAKEMDGLNIEYINDVPYVRIFSNKRNGKPCKTYSFLVKLIDYKNNNK